MLAVLAVGLQANGSETSSDRVPAQVPESMSSAPGTGYDAVAAAQQSAAAGDGVILASADSVLSYSRSVVLTGAGDDAGKLNLASADRRRPAVGALMAPLAALAPSSPYGLRMNPITGSAGEFHWGLDFAAACGTHVHSADAGVVRAVGWHQGGGGNRVEIDHGNGLITTYNHLEGIAVKAGQPLQAGDIIAKVGTTGASTGCHLHFETVLNGNHTDPANWTLEPLTPGQPLTGATMTDYRGTTAAAPAWVVSAAQIQIHRHEAEEHGHAVPESTKLATPSAPPSTPAAAPASSPSPTTVPAPTAVPSTASAPAPTVMTSAVPVPSPTAAQTTAPSAG